MSTNILIASFASLIIFLNGNARSRCIRQLLGFQVLQAALLSRLVPWTFLWYWVEYFHKMEPVDVQINSTHGDSMKLCFLASLSSKDVHDITPFWDFLLHVSFLFFSVLLSFHLIAVKVTQRACVPFHYKQRYIVLTENDIHERQEEAIRRVSSVFSIPRESACILLRQYKWSVMLPKNICSLPC